MLKEAYRVLTPGGAACFTITGNPEDCKMLTIVPTVLKNHTKEESESADGRAKRSYFHLSIDGGVKLKQDLVDTGFERIKIWEQPANVYFENGTQFMDKMGDHWLDAQMDLRKLDKNLTPMFRESCIK